MSIKDWIKDKRSIGCLVLVLGLSFPSVPRKMARTLMGLPDKSQEVPELTLPSVVKEWPRPR
jgi:hypothetical protein